MKIQKFVCLLLVFILTIPATGSIHEETTRTQISSFEDPKGVVLLDDLHDNDYTDGALSLVATDLETKGYVTRYASNFSTWEEALSFSHYLVITAPFGTFQESEINAISTWFQNGSKNLLIASRGDFEAVKTEEINNILQSVGAGTRVNHDNVYTTDSSARREWYIETDNFNENFPTLFTGVSSINFFSPSSVIPGSNASTLIFAEAEAYQTDQNPPPPDTIFDDTNDGVGGDIIPLATLESVDDDRVVVVGTTLWSDFDYGDSSADDTVFFDNVLNYFTEETRKYENIIIELPDPEPPIIKISNPRDGGIVKGTVKISSTVSDPFGIESVELWIDTQKIGNITDYQWDTTMEADGVHTIKVIAQDLSGNIAEKSVSVTVDQDFVPQLRNPAKVMTYNIKESGIFPQWIDVVKEENPDILVLVETGDFDDNNNELMNQYKDELNQYFMDFLPYNAYTLQGIAMPFDGITIYSRFDIKSGEKIVSLDLDSGAKQVASLPFLHAVVSIFGQDVHVIGGHLTCCPGEDNELSREKEQEGILNFMDSLGNVPIIYAGDMNSHSPDDPEPHDLGTEPIDMVINPENPKTAIFHEFIDVYKEVNPSSTQPTYIVSGIESRIDFIFVNQWFFGRILNSTIGDTPSAALGSDHVPVDAFVDFKDMTTPDPISHEFATSAPPTSSSTEEPSNIVFPMSALSLIPIFLKKRRSKKNFEK